MGVAASYARSLAAALRERRQPPSRAYLVCWAIVVVYTAIYVGLCIALAPPDEPHDYFSEGDAIDSMSAMHSR